MPRRFRRRRPAAVIALAVLAGAVAIRGYYSRQVRDEHRPPAQPLSEGSYDVLRVIDGDTIVIAYPSAGDDDGHAAGPAEKTRVRLFGIDAPEAARDNQPAERYSGEATEFAREFLAEGRADLVFGGRKTDRYGRLLAYVYVDGVMLNEELVRQGLATVYHYPGDSEAKARRIRKAEEEAQGEGRGLYSRSQKSPPSQPEA